MTDPAPKPIAEDTWPCEFRCGMCGNTWTLDIPRGIGVGYKWDGLCKDDTRRETIKCPNCQTTRNVAKLSGMWR